MFRAKTYVDICVTGALGCLLLAPHWTLQSYVDCIASWVVAVYLVIEGVKLLHQTKEKSI